MPAFAVTIDADCLFPAALRDTLLRLAQKGLYQPHWSDEILAEVTRNLRLRELMTEEQTRYLSAALHDAFPEAFVTGYKKLIPALTCNEKDRHVLAVAIRSHSQILVTNNVRDFPASSIEGYELEVQTPDDFLCNQLELDTPLVSGVIVAQTAALRNPPRTIQEVLAVMDKTVPEFAKSLLRELGLGDTPAVLKQAEDIVSRSITRKQR